MTMLNPHYTEVNPTFCRHCCAAWNEYSGCGYQYFNVDDGKCLWHYDRADREIKRQVGLSKLEQGTKFLK